MWVAGAEEADRPTCPGSPESRTGTVTMRFRLHRPPQLAVLMHELVSAYEVFVPRHLGIEVGLPVLPCCPLRGNRVWNNYAALLTLEPCRARPTPIACPLHQPTTHRVEVNVVDHRRQGSRFDDIAIATGAGLPEVPLGPASATLSDARKPLRSMPSEIRRRATPDGLLDCTQDQFHLVNRLTRPDDQVDVLGHKHVRL